MTKKEYSDFKKLLNSRKSGKTSAQQTSAKVGNLEKRLQAGGVDTDNRNFIEKALNLPDKQGILLDVFELLNRPQQAIFGGIDSMQNDGTFGEGALEGLKGNKDTRFKQILKNEGMSDREGKLDIVDILGFAGDVVLDPMNFKIIPTGNGLKAADDLIFQGIGKSIKGTAKVADKYLEKGLKALDETKGIVDKTGTMATKLEYINPTAKFAGNLGKKVKEITQYNPVTKAYEIVEEASKYIPKGRLETYKEVKNWFTRSFDIAASIPQGALEVLRKGNADQHKALRELNVLRQQMIDKIDLTAKMMSNGEDVAKVTKELNEQMLSLKEFRNMTKEVDTLGNLLKSAKKGHIAYDEKLVKKMNELADDINKADRGLKLTIENVDGKIKLSDDWDIAMHSSGLRKGSKKAQATAEMYGLGEIFDKNKLRKKYVVPKNYTAEQLSNLKALDKKWNEVPELKELYSELDNIFNEGNKRINDIFNVNIKTATDDNLAYVRHALDADLEGAKKIGIKNADKFIPGGNTKVLSDRKYQMSVMEANNLWEEQIAKSYDDLTKEGKEFIDKNRKLFKNLYTDSFDDYMKNIPQIAKNNKFIDEVLVNQTFGNWKESDKVAKELKLAQKAGDTKLVEKLTKKYAGTLDNLNMKILTNKDNVVPSGFKVLDKEERLNLLNKMDNIAEQLGIESMRESSEFLRKNGGKLAMNQDLIRLLDVSSKIKQEAPAILRMYDSVLNMFKRGKTLTPQFQFNNLAGNTFNMYAGGMNIDDIFKRYTEAAEIIKKQDDLLLKSAQGLSLNKLEKRQLKFLENFFNAGFGDSKIAFDLMDMPESLRPYFLNEKQFKNVKDFIVDGLPYLNNKMNMQMDNMARLAAFIEASENPKLLKSLNVNNAGEAVRKMLFDPSESTEFERSVMKRIVPFYTFTKKNLMYQISNLGQNGSRYVKFMNAYKSVMNSATNNNYDNVADFIKENLYLPYPSKGKKGEYKMLRVNLPFGTLLSLTSNPLKESVGMIAPGIRAPFEYANNISTFTGRPIEKYSGEKSKDLPFLSKKQEFLIGQTTGADAPMKAISRLLRGVSEGNGINDVISSDYNTADDELYKSYERLNELEEMMKQYKQKGYQFSTINELKKSNSNAKLNSIMTQLNKFKGIKENPYQHLK